MFKKLFFSFLLSIFITQVPFLVAMDAGAASSSTPTEKYAHLQNVLSTKNLSVENLTNELKREAMRLSPQEKKSYDTSKHLFWCTCANMTPRTRVEIIFTLIDRILAQRQSGRGYDLTSLVSHTDLGEEKGLQSYLTVYTLFRIGFKSVALHMINKNISIADMKTMLYLIIENISKRFFPKQPTRKDPNPSVPTEEFHRRSTAMIKCMNAGYVFYGTVSTVDGLIYADNIQALAASKALTPPFFASESYVIVDPVNINIQCAYTFFSKNPLPKLAPEGYWGWVCDSLYQKTTKATHEEFVQKVCSTQGTDMGCNAIHIKIDRLTAEKPSFIEKIATIKQRYHQPPMIATLPSELIPTEISTKFNAQLKQILEDLMSRFSIIFTENNPTELRLFLDELKTKMTELVPPDFVIMVSFDYSSYCRMLYEFDALIDKTSRRTSPASIIVGSQDVCEDYQFDPERRCRLPL